MDSKGEPTAKPTTADIRTVIAASAAGTAFEWYDFYIYGTLATFFGKYFFPPGDDTAVLRGFLRHGITNAAVAIADAGAVTALATGSGAAYGVYAGFMATVDNAATSSITAPQDEPDLRTPSR